MRAFPARRSPLFLDVFRLRPGDIILSRARAFSSKKIALWTGGCFSHAQLVVAPGGVIVESTYDEDFAGVNCSLPPYQNVERKGEPVAGIRVIRRYRYFEVFRYSPTSEQESVRLKAFTKEVFRKALRYCGEPYANAQTLISLSPLLQSVKVLRELAESLGDAIIRTPWNGIFCSQLIAVLYAEAGIPLGGDGAHTTLYTPNELSRLKTLKCITNAVLVTPTIKQRLRLKLSTDTLTLWAMGKRARSWTLASNAFKQRLKVEERNRLLNNIRVVREMTQQMPLLLNDLGVAHEQRAGMAPALVKLMEHFLERAPWARVQDDVRVFFQLINSFGTSEVREPETGGKRKES